MRGALEHRGWTHSAGVVESFYALGKSLEKHVMKHFLLEQNWSLDAQDY